VGFDPGDPSQRPFTAYGHAKFPDVRDTELDDYVAGLVSGGPTAVKAALDAVSEHGRRVLRVYAERAATRAVRERAPDLLVRALVALVVGGLEQNALEALIPMAVVEDAGHRIGAEPGDFFGTAADIVGHPGTVSLFMWLTRKPDDRSLECMGFTADSDESGFRYRWSA
jgi:hypothetical protein